MFQGWRFKLREAEEAFEQGQLDEACQLLMRGDLRQYLPGKRLSHEVASSLLKRARQHVIRGDSAAGWRDLQTARTLAGEVNAVIAGRREIVAILLADAESHIATGDTSRALTLIDDLERHGILDEAVRQVRELARRIDSATHLARRGKFGDAADQLETATDIRAELPILQRKLAEYREKQTLARGLAERLHAAMAAKTWTEAVAVADQLLELAPEHRLAQDARRRAWAKVGAKVGDSQLGHNRQVFRSTPTGSGDTQVQFATGTATAESPEGLRFLLWVDGVGGYLVCLSDEVTLGQSTPNCRVHVPILADVSRHHASICRRGDGYVVQPVQTTRVNGQIIRETTLLTDGDEIELGDGVRLRFRQPHALSASARLEFVSHHRTHPSADGVLLMAESCVLGPKWQNHVVCADWQNDVVLYRRDDELYCRAMDSIEIDGQLCDGRGRIGPNSHVAGSDFSMSLEQLP
jgi:hypothetical protein